MHAHGSHDWLTRLKAWESRLALQFNRANRRRASSALFGAISDLGDGLFWYGLMAAMLVSQGPAALKPVLVMIAAGAACTFTYRWLKSTTSRERPCQQHPGIRVTTLPLDYYSFPSGHTLHAVCFSVVAVSYYPALWWLLLPFTLLVVASRLILGLHYLSDVIAGALIGGTIAFAGLYLAGYLPF
jgi:undecaprenyl-diphosphatase